MRDAGCQWSLHMSEQGTRAGQVSAVGINEQHDHQQQRIGQGVAGRGAVLLRVYIISTPTDWVALVAVIEADFVP